MPIIRVHAGELVSPIQSLERYFQDGGVSIIQAAFAHSYFVHPDRVRERTPYYPDHARYSREHYPGLDKGKTATWSGDGRPVRLDDNQRAQMAWEKYTNSRIYRGSGYGVRHIWGEPWNPDAFTAGWNICYMPFWAGMLTENQHQHPELQQAIQQASWELYFRENPVCPPPDFVENPGMDLEAILEGQPLLVLAHPTSANHSRPSRQAATVADDADISDDAIIERVRGIKKDTHQSWPNISKAARSLQGKDHDHFSTPNVESSAKSCVRKICRETGLTPAKLETLMPRLHS